MPTSSSSIRTFVPARSSEFQAHPATLQGIRTRDNIRMHQKIPPGASLTEQELVDTVNALEGKIAENGRIAVAAGGRGIELLPGVAPLLQKLRDGNARFGIVTSGRSRMTPWSDADWSLATRLYATSALTTAGICPPALPFTITSELCTHGKPHPEPYLTGLEALAELPGPAFVPSDVLVFEDAPSGLASGLAAGCKTLAVCTGQPRARIRATAATHRVVDLSRLEVVRVAEGLITLRFTTLEEEEESTQ